MNRDGVITFLVVAAISVLVWTLAEGQTLQRFGIDIAVAVDDGVVGPGGPGGPPERMARERAGAGGRSGRGAGSRAGVGPRRSDPERGRGDLVRDRIGERDLKTAIAADAAFAHSGVNVVRVEPPMLSLDIDQRLEVELPVRVRAPEGVLRDTPSVEPAQVRVTVPAGLAEFLPDAAVVTIGGSALDRLRPGEASVLPGVAARLEGLPAEVWGVTLDPPQVDVSVRIRRRSDSIVVPLIPVHVVLPPSAAGRWEVELGEGSAAFVDVPFAGPVEAISEIRRGVRIPLAVVRLTEQDLAEQTLTRGVELIGVPDTVIADLAAIGADGQVEVRLVPREEEGVLEGVSEEPPGGEPSE